MSQGCELSNAWIKNSTINPLQIAIIPGMFLLRCLVLTVVINTVASQPIAMNQVANILSQVAIEGGNTLRKSVCEKSTIPISVASITVRLLTLFIKKTLVCESGAFPG